jgi:DNA-binding CsgD family transcriptional regulator
MQDNRDSAFIYFDKALQLAEFYNDTLQQVRIVQNLGVAYMQIDSLVLAKEKLLYANASSSKVDKGLEATVHLNLAHLYYELHQKDSAYFYLNTALGFFEANNKTSSLSKAYGLFSKLEAEAGNYKKAWEYSQKYAKYLAKIYKERENNNVLKIEKKYHFEQVQNEKNWLLIERQWIFVGFLIVLIAAGVISFYSYRKSVRYKTLQMEHDIALLEAEQRIQTLLGLTEKQVKKEDGLKTLIFEEWEIFKRANKIKQFTQTQKENISPKDFILKVNKILYGQSGHDWDKIYKTLDGVYDNHFSEFRQQHPELTEIETQIICLSCCNFSNKEIGVLLVRAENTIQQKKTQIRHKLRMESRKEFKSFLDI